MPPQSMQNEVCMKVLQGSDGNLEVLDKQICRHRFVFIMGLHHSGTSLIDDVMQSHELTSGHNNTGALEDHGQVSG